MGKILGHPLTIVFITLCTVIFSLSMSRGGRHNIDYQPQVQTLEARQKELETQKEILEFEKELSSKPVVQEKIIRDDLWLQKPGEVILDLSDFQMTTTQISTTQTPPPTPLTQWKQLLFN